MMKKKYIIVTNNRKIRKEYIRCSHFSLMFKESLPDVLDLCLKLIKEGYTLAVDPLAGYLSRMNPYHTIVLEAPQSNLNEESRALKHLKDVSKIDALLSRYWLRRKEYDFNGSCEEFLEDHEYVDASIGRNSIEAIKLK